MPLPLQPNHSSDVCGQLTRTTSTWPGGPRIAERISLLEPRWWERRWRAWMGAELDAQRLYEDAIRTAQAYELVQHEAMAQDWLAASTQHADS